MKRYFAIVLPQKKSAAAVLLAGYERDGKIIKRGKLVGFALDYYEDEAVAYKKDMGESIIGDFATRQEAETAIEKFLNT